MLVCLIQLGLELPNFLLHLFVLWTFLERPEILHLSALPGTRVNGVSLLLVLRPHLHLHPAVINLLELAALPLPLLFVITQYNLRLFLQLFVTLVNKVYQLLFKLLNVLFCEQVGE